MSATDDHGLSAEIDAELDAIVMEQQIPELRDYIKVLRAEVATLREQVSHLTSGQAELTLRRLAIIDDTGAERITAGAGYGDGSAELKIVAGGDPSKFHAQAYLWAGPGQGEDPDAGESITFAMGGPADVDLIMRAGVDLKRPAGQASIEFVDPHAHTGDGLRLDVAGFHRTVAGMEVTS